jgi:hypothetical protein
MRDDDERRRRRDRDGARRHADERDDAWPPPLPKRFPRPGEQVPRDFTLANIIAACNWLRDYLRDGPKVAETIYKLADACGIPHTLLKIAKKRLGVEHYDANEDCPAESYKLWKWRLPPRKTSLFDD